MKKDELKEELQQKNAVVQAVGLNSIHIIPFQFRQLMHNLIGNSLKFSKPEKAPVIRIFSKIGKGIDFNNPKLSLEQKYCHIVVKDNGIIVAKGEIDKGATFDIYIPTT